VERLPFVVEPANHRNHAVDVNLEIRGVSNHTVAWSTMVTLAGNSTARFQHGAIHGNYNWTVSGDGQNCTVTRPWIGGYQGWYPELRADGSIVQRFVFDDYDETVPCEH